MIGQIKMLLVLRFAYFMSFSVLVCTQDCKMTSETCNDSNNCCGVAAFKDFVLILIRIAGRLQIPVHIRIALLAPTVTSTKLVQLVKVKKFANENFTIFIHTTYIIYSKFTSN
ncbi:hypothetical protein WA026_013345 [Henosepilachna vigintioctopunctata]|uniref:Uncharacterized protein n=1 Tax=Henosepilachna vigintioctopunctata TaxID=420089 RepID=A0AAW1V5P6_9CUCU